MPQIRAADAKVGQILRPVQVSYDPAYGPPAWQNSIKLFSRSPYAGYGRRIAMLNDFVPEGVAVITPESVLETIDAPEEVREARKKFVNFSSIPLITKSHGDYVGTDPEIFILSPTREVIPAWRFLPDKRMSASYGSHWDGVQAEWCPAPKSCHEELTQGIRLGMSYVWNMALEINPKCYPTPESVVTMDLKVLADALPEHAALGCSPSLNIYGVRGAEVPEPRALPLRFAGFHLHYSLPFLKGDDEMLKRVVKSLDRVAGVASVALLRGIESPIRRRFYGLAGEFRLPAHGLEWRTLSSSGLCHPTVTYLLLDLARISMMNLGLLGALEEWDTTDEETQEVINDLDVKGALKILKRNLPILRSFFTKLYNGENALPYILLRDGAMNVLEVNNMIRTWGLKDMSLALQNRVSQHSRSGLKDL